MGPSGWISSQLAGSSAGRTNLHVFLAPKDTHPHTQMQAHKQREQIFGNVVSYLRIFLLRDGVACKMQNMDIHIFIYMYISIYIYLFMYIYVCVYIYVNIYLLFFYFYTYTHASNKKKINSCIQRIVSVRR